jgi:hypothetical protein
MIEGNIFMSKYLFIILYLSPFSAYSSELKNQALNSTGINLIKSNKKLLFSGITSVSLDKSYRNILSSGIPNHLVGDFPNKNNPYQITSQTYDFSIRLKPKMRKTITVLKENQYFGIALNGIPFDPILDEWFMNKKSSGWQYEALSGAIPLGIDTNHAHVDQNGADHYHGLPKLLLKNLGIAKGKLSPLIGYAADGFPIRALYGLKGKPVKSSYSLKRGKRTIGGNFDGSFVQDYQYIKNSGELDQCNGKMVNGIYTYFITSSFPVIPRCFVGKPHKSFTKIKPNKDKISL